VKFEYTKVEAKKCHTSHGAFEVERLVTEAPSYQANDIRYDSALTTMQLKMLGRI